MQPSRDIARLIEIMAALRTPETGCPWDLEQDFTTIAPYTIEEAYEVADAIERGDRRELCEELGDLLLQVAFHARMAEEEGSFDFGNVVEAITAKMIRRHPHVFGDETARSAGMAKGMWERIKAGEKAGSVQAGSLLDDVARALPALLQAQKLQARAATVGFDWQEAGRVLDKVEEEIGELRAAIGAESREAMADEIGDLLFALVNLARHCGVDAETALRGTNEKFRSRFRRIEQGLARAGKPLNEASLEEMEELWQEAKAHETPVTADDPAGPR
jgi:ATP diphosphatase